MKSKARKYRKILVIVSLLSAFYTYKYIDKQLEPSFTDQDFSDFSEMKNIFQSILQKIYEKHSDCNDARLLFKPERDLNNWQSTIFCENKKYSINISLYNSEIENLLLKYKIQSIITQVDSNKELVEISFYKNISVHYARNIYTINECDIKVIEDITAIPDEKIEVCKMYCQKLKYQNWYLCKTIEESKVLF